MVWHNRKALLLFGLAAGLLILLGVGLPDAFNPSVQTVGSGSVARPLLGEFSERTADGFNWLFYLFMFIYLLAVVSIFLTVDGRRRFLILALMIAGMILILAFFKPRERIRDANPLPAASSLALETSEVVPTPASEVISPGEPPAIPDWIVTAFVLVLAVLLAGVVVLAVIALGQRKPSESLPDEISRQAQVALDELEAGGDYPDVIIRCYARMSQVLQVERGLERDRAMTPHEFEHSLIQHGFPETPVRVLTHLFEEVRYGNIPTSEKGGELAVASLSAIVAYCQSTIEDSGRQIR